MLILTHAGPGYRSKLLTRELADTRAARHYHTGRFRYVEVMEAPKVTGERRWYVMCLPSDPAEQAALLQQFDADRHDRAAAEGPRYVWAPVPDDPDAWYVSPLSQNVYTVTTGGACTCRDAGVCADNGLTCKHALALSAGLGLFLSPDHQFGAQRILAALGQSIGQPAAQREPVAVPVAA